MIRQFFIFLVVLSFFFPVYVSAYEFEGIPILPKVFDPPYERDLYKHWIDADGLPYFIEQRNRIDPTRTDVITWADLRDLEEGHI